MSDGLDADSRKQKKRQAGRHKQQTRRNFLEIS